MTVTKVDLAKAVSNLNNLTRDGRITWRECDAALRNSGQFRSISSSSIAGVRNAFCTDYQGKMLRLSEQPSTVTLQTFFNPEQPYKLEIIEPDGSVLFSFPDVAGIADLYQSVKFKTSDVENIIRSLANQQ